MKRGHSSSNERIDDLKKILGQIWFVKGNFENIVHNELVVERAESVKKIVQLIADYDSTNRPFTDRLILDNYFGSLQRYLTGYDLSSIHLSSKSLEIAFLFKIITPTEAERISSFGVLCSSIIDRRLIEQERTIKAAWNVVNRRNMTVHDAILEQAVQWVHNEYIDRKIEELPTTYQSLFQTKLNPLVKRVQNRKDQFNSLPDLRWYVRDISFESTRTLIVNFLDETIGVIFPKEHNGKKGILEFFRQIPRIIENSKSVFRYGTDFIKYSARANLKDVKIVLDELYCGELFRF